MNTKINNPASKQSWLDTINNALENNLVIVPTHPRVRYFETWVDPEEVDTYLCPFDECIPLISDYCDTNGTNYHTINKDKLMSLRGYINNYCEGVDNNDLTGNIVAHLRGDQVLTHPDFCNPQNTSWRKYVKSCQPLITELFGVTVGAVIVNDACFTRIDGELKCVAAPRWRQVYVSVDNDKRAKYNMPIDVDDQDTPACSINELYTQYKVKLPEGTNRSALQQRGLTYECPVLQRELVFTTNHGFVASDSTYTYDNTVYPSWVGYEFEDTRYVSLDHYCDSSGREVDDIRSYHRTPECVVHRSPHHPQSKLASLLRTYTIGFEVEKRDYLSNNGEMPRSDLFRGWEYDGSCGIEGISNIYTLDNLTKFKRHCNRARFELNLPINDSCGGHINIGCKQHPLKKIHLRPIAGLLYAIYKDRMRNSYCHNDKRLLADNPDRYCIIRHKRNDITELRLASAYANETDIIKAFELMKHVISVADHIKIKYSMQNNVTPSTESIQWYGQLTESPRYKRAKDFDFLDKWYRQNQLPAWHSNFNGAGAQMPGQSARGIWVLDYLYLLIDTLTPWFNSYYTTDQRKRLIQDAYAFHHYVLRSDATSFTTKTITQYI